MDDAYAIAQVTDLGRADALLLLAMRWWVEERLAGRSALPRLRRAMEHADAANAACSVDALMEIILRTARRPVATHSPRCRAVSPDEATLLRVAALAQAGWPEDAQACLAAGLLAPAGARFALGPLLGLGRVFAAAGMMLGVPGVMAAGWATAPLSRTVH